MSAAPIWLDAYYLGIFTVAYYFGVFAMSWDLLFGFAGEVNFGPSFLIGIGAYTAALGFNVAKHKLAAFCISALFSGTAGAMLVFYEGAASVDTIVDIAIGVQVIIAAVLGGRRTVLGAALGAVFLIALGEALRPLGELATLIVSVIALLVILVFPTGFLGLLRGGRA